MPAIPVHHTETSDRAWDGPANEARLLTDQDYSYYRRAYAWRDPDGDESNKSSYKFIHHEVDSDGNPGPANVRACITGIAVLNGARGGTTIPASDRRGVWRHLAAHLEDADVEPPELKQRSALMDIERRAFPFSDIEVRADEDDSPRIIGYAAVFNEPSEDLGGFQEIIRPGAFRKTIQEADIRALWNHNPDYVLGRNKSGTLMLEEDDRGLKIEIIPPDTTWARDLMQSMKRGDVDQMSFGFRTIKDRWRREDGKTVRELLEVELFDVSPVTYPAYPQTSVQVRSILANAGIDFDALAGVIMRHEHGLELTGSDRDVIRRAMDVLQNYLPAEPGQGFHSAGDAGDEHSAQGRRLSILRKRLEVAEKAVL